MFVDATSLCAVCVAARAGEGDSLLAFDCGVVFDCMSTSIWERLSSFWALEAGVTAGGFLARGVGVWGACGHTGGGSASWSKLVLCIIVGGVGVYGTLGPPSPNLIVAMDVEW